MHPALVIAGKDLRQRLRDRSAWILGILAPVGVAMLISFAFRGAETFHTTVAVADLDRGPVAAAFTGFLTGPELDSVLAVETVPGVAEARQRVDDGGASAALVIPAGFSAAAHSGAAVPVTVLTDVDAPMAGEVARSVAAAFVAQLNADLLATRTALAAGADPAGLAERAAALRLPEQVVSRAGGTAQQSGVSYYAPAMGMFFMFFSIGFTARGYFTEQRSGLLDRVAAAPVAPGTVLTGKALATFAYGTASLGTVALITTLGFAADWGPPGPVALLIVALGLALVCLTAFVITLARTERQAEGLAAIVTFGLVLLGGNFVYLGGAPDIIRTLTLATPNGWALRGFTDLSGGAGWPAVWPPLLAILAFCVVLGGASALLARRDAAR
ncbi:ABC transporter permease [Amycolatopsis tucumanensis]|uniref:ABC transporter permease n=1 Tax=Amycolatopsis tucumanensis TaxID=401106 RepID=UPI003D70EC16